MVHSNMLRKVISYTALCIVFLVLCIVKAAEEEDPKVAESRKMAERFIWKFVDETFSAFGLDTKPFKGLLERTLKKILPILFDLCDFLHEFAERKKNFPEISNKDKIINI